MWLTAVRADVGTRRVQDARGRPVGIQRRRRHEIRQVYRAVRLAQFVQRRQALSADVAGKAQWRPGSAQPGEHDLFGGVIVELRCPGSPCGEFRDARRCAYLVAGYPEQIGGQRYRPRLVKFRHVLRAAQPP
jgi:hypothetical protein